MAETDTVATGKVVSIHYTLTVEGSVVDSSAGSDPLEYLHGADNIVPGLERQLEGRRVGDKLNVSVTPEDGYGTRSEDAVQTVPRSVFPGDAELTEGMSFQAQDEDGEAIMGTIVELTAATATVDFNHPLAGQTLNFEIEITGMRSATKQEREHGHAHGAGGHHH